jgi:hypothetical protein
MKVNLPLLKSWCEQQFSPIAWQRISLHVYGQLKDKYSLKELQEPGQDMTLEGDALAVVCDAIRELYKVEVPLNDFS